MALSPYHPFWYYIPFYLSGLDDGDYSSALEYARKAHIPGMWWSHEFLIPPLAFLGEDEKAQREAQEVLRLFPEFPNIFWFSHSNWNLPVHLQEMMADGLRKSGVELPPNPAEAGEM